jgi:O-antigen ligase
MCITLLLVLLWSIPLHFKLFTLICCLVFFFLCVLFQSWIAALVSLLVMSAQFTYQGKYYDVLLIEPGRVALEPFFSNGVLGGFGITIPDICTLALLLIAGKIYIQHLISVTKSPAYITKIKHNSAAIVITLCWYIFFSLSLYSSLMYSPYPTNSLIHLFGYLMFPCAALATAAFTRASQKNRAVCIALLSGTILFQSCLGLFQIAEAATHMNLNARNEILAYLPEQNTIFARPTGSFDHANQFGFMLLLSIFALLYLAPKQTTLMRAILASGFVLAILSQSRTIWIIGLLLCVPLYRTYGQYLRQTLKPLLNTRTLILLLGVISGICALVVIPRLGTTQYAFSDGSGSIRIQMIQEGILAFLQKPWNGYGIDTNIAVMIEQFPMGYIHQFPFDIHMAYLQLALEAGIVAMLAFFFPFLFLLRQTIKRPLSKQLSTKNLLVRCCIVTILLYYCLQPHGGKHELLLLGYIIGLMI